MRSKLFVPATRPEFFEKALSGDADGLSFDLEDSVVESRKAEARETLRTFLLGERPRACGKSILVRINGAGTPHLNADLEAAVQPGVHMINLPKPASPSEVRQVSSLIGALERVRGVVRPIGLLLNIETPQALRSAAELAKADSRVCGLQIGLGDLFEPLGIDRGQASAVRQVMFEVRMAAAEAGVPAFDGAFTDVLDGEGFRAEAGLARSFGLAGKTCIHPRQVGLANEVFTPGADSIREAIRITRAVDAANAQGLGAFLLDGRMIDAPFVAWARRIVEDARRLGLIEGQASS